MIEETKLKITTELLKCIFYYDYETYELKFKDEPTSSENYKVIRNGFTLKRLLIFNINGLDYKVTKACKDSYGKHIIRFKHNDNDYLHYDASQLKVVIALTTNRELDYNNKVYFLDNDKTNTKYDNILVFDLSKDFVSSVAKHYGYLLVSYIPNNVERGNSKIGLLNITTGEEIFCRWRDFKYKVLPNRKISKFSTDNLKEHLQFYKDYKITGIKRGCHRISVTLKHKCGYVFNTRYNKLATHKVECKKCNSTGKSNPSWDGGYCSHGVASYDKYSPFFKLFYDVGKEQRGDLTVLTVPCYKCNKMFAPDYYRVLKRLRFLSGLSKEHVEFFCSDECRKACEAHGKTEAQLIKLARIKAGLETAEDTYRVHQREWSTEVKRLAGHVCVRCFKNETTLKEELSWLEAHHIVPVAINPLISLDLDNGECLCKQCHDAHHQTPGNTYEDIKKMAAKIKKGCKK